MPLLVHTLMNTINHEHIHHSLFIRHSILPESSSNTSMFVLVLTETQIWSFASVKITVCSAADRQTAVHQLQKTSCVRDNSRRRFPRPCKRSTASSTRAPFTVMSLEHCHVITKVVFWHQISFLHRFVYHR